MQNQYTSREENIYRSIDKKVIANTIYLGFAYLIKAL